MPKISAAQRALNQENLLDAAATLIAERGFDAVSLRDVSERAGLARTAIYNYVQDKTELLIAANERSSADMRQAIAAAAADPRSTAVDRLDAVVELMVGSLTHDARNLMLLRAVHSSLVPEQRARALAPFKDEVGAQLAEIIAAGVESGEFGGAEDPGLRLELVAGALAAAVERVLAEPESAGAVYAGTRDFLHNALGAAPVLAVPHR